MDLTNSFDVPASIDEAWAALTDIELIAPCMPGATLTEVDGDTYRGTVKVKVGPITAKFKGEASFTERDEQAHRAQLKASGRDTGGKGNASAIITAQLTPDGDGTHVEIVTDLSISGKVAQFGRSAMADISAKLIGQFTECLETTVLGPGPEEVAEASAELSGSDSTDTGTATADRSGSTTARSGSSTARSGAGDDGATGAPAGPRRIDAREADPIDLIDSAGGSMAKALIPAGIVLVIVVWFLRRRR